MLRNFKVLMPASLNEALYVINNIDRPFRFLAGGTDVLVRLKDNPSYAQALIDISKIGELAKIEEHKSTFVIGSGVRHEALLAYAPFIENYNGLIEAVSAIGSPQIRALATVGGNIGNASPAGDSIGPLMAFDAEVELRSQDTNRIVKLEDFFTGPGKTVLKHNEIITKIILPKSDSLKSGWKRLGQRRAVAISKVSVTLALGFAKHSNGSDRVNDVRIALGAVAPTVIRARKAEKFLLENQTLTKAVVKEACRLVAKEARPITDIRSNTEYRSEMCGVLLGDLIEKLACAR
ncbi:MAG: Nicotinate dehydrogenase FAD-subunit [bacterium ADurb.Bin243]|nr:MAG: Nicotinate dehydrogenase FAD-subunit [bacterium ADurb.Bin243]